MAATYSAFPADEFTARFERARETVRDMGCVACLMVAPEHLYYFGGYDSWVSVNSPQALIFTAGEDAPTLILRDVDVTLATETTWVGDIRTYNLVLEDYPTRIREIFAEKGLAGGLIAIERVTYALPAALADALDAALPEFAFADASDAFGRLRLIKSPAEIAYLEQAGALANIGLAAMTASIAEGVTEIAVAAEIEAAMRRAGSDYPSVPTELCSGPRSAGGHATPRGRAILSGDIVHAEFAGVAERYHATAIQTVSLGEPSARARELYDAGIASLNAGMAAIAPGAAVAAVEEASLEPLRAHGLEDAAQMRFGYGIGIAYPPIWLESLQIARGFDFTLQPGMVFVLHSCLQLPDEGLGVIQGGTWVLEAGGLRMLAGAGACELMVL